MNQLIGDSTRLAQPFKWPRSAVMSRMVAKLAGRRSAIGVSGSCLGDVATQNDSTICRQARAHLLLPPWLVSRSCLCSPLHLCLEGFLALELLSLFTTTMSLSAMHFECYALRGTFIKCKNAKSLSAMHLEALLSNAKMQNLKGTVLWRGSRWRRLGTRAGSDTSCPKCSYPSPIACM
eukprot:g55657.t1